MKETHIFSLILIAGMLCFSVSINAQMYSIESFQKVAGKVNLYYKPFSGILAISYESDTLFIENYLSTYETKVINKNFLMVTYNKLADLMKG